MTYRRFFEHLTGNPPFPYQDRLSVGPWPELLDVPTGLGKTAAVTVAWLWKRLQSDPETGRRLVYCLPMRVLVDQTERVARALCEQARRHFEEEGVPLPTVHVLMGGDLDESWEHEPERPAILVGTQDMLMSRALNRGYAMSRYKWPLHFALLNNDCLWVFDETQLLGVGIETSAQLQGLRERLGSHGGSRSLWMSATLGEAQLHTVDHPRPPEGWRRHQLDANDLAAPAVTKRTEARKTIERLKLPVEGEHEPHLEELADHVARLHAERGGLTLIVLNRVHRAQYVFQRLRASAVTSHIGLVHSRFRRGDRSAQEMLLEAMADRIVVATQAVEAGVDVSARTLITELAPWPSLVQRFGRCNRYGEESDARILWVDVDTKDSKARPFLPYSAADLDTAREILRRLCDGNGDAGPGSLKQVRYVPPAVVRPVLRRRDLLDLFDTTPDLCGNDLDISRFVRDGDDTDVQFFWRVFDGQPGPELARPHRDELCRASLPGGRDFLQRLERQRKKLEGRSSADRERVPAFTAWNWNPLERRWEPQARVRPGHVVLLHQTAGGYDPTLGWTGDVGVSVPESPPGAARDSADKLPVEEDAHHADPESSGAHWLSGSARPGRWVRLADHLGHVRGEADQLAQDMALDRWRAVLATAGLWHDVGKAHPQFQKRLVVPTKERPEDAPPEDGIWAKSSHRRRWQEGRRHFRHELASALAWLAHDDIENERARDLIAYLLAAHHGKVRLSIRSIPNERQPDEPGRLFARGVWDGDRLPAIEMPEGRRLPEVALELGVMRLGEGSWLERMLALRDARDLGPFRLALLETTLRVADWRASRKEQAGAYDA